MAVNVFGRTGNLASRQEQNAAARLKPTPFQIWLSHTFDQKNGRTRAPCYPHWNEAHMKAIMSAQRTIRSAPETPAAKTLAGLMASLESESQFDLGSLYQLDFESFELALAILKDWRIDRYCAGKAKLFESPSPAHSN
jgi:hypothetical protein